MGTRGPGCKPGSCRGYGNVTALPPISCVILDTSQPSPPSPHVPCLLTLQAPWAEAPLPASMYSTVHGGIPRHQLADTVLPLL